MTDTNEYGYVIPEDTEENSYIDDTSENEGKENYDDEIAVQAPVGVSVTWYLDGTKVGMTDSYGSGSWTTPTINQTKVTVNVEGSVSTTFTYDYGCVIGSVYKVDGIDSTSVYATKLIVTDLTNTEWYFNETIDVGDEDKWYWKSSGAPEADAYDINFICNGVSYKQMFSPGTLVYDAGWEDDVYRTISITGGDDAKSTSLINWLYSNATLISAPEPITRQFTRLYKGIIPHGQSNNKCFKQYARGLNEFDVDGVSYYFPNETIQITWQQWVNSEYNTAGYSIDDYGYVLTASPFYGVLDGELRKGTDLIISGDSFDLGNERIFFRIDGKTYYSFEYYDFEWWVDSNYNTDGFYLDDDDKVRNAEDKVINGTSAGNAIKDDTDYYSESATLISFSIGGTTYQAEEGMTWGEWVESEYNTDGTWTIYSNGYIQKSDTTDHPMWVSASQTVKGTVSATDVIIANHSYVYYDFGVY